MVITKTGQLILILYLYIYIYIWLVVSIFFNFHSYLGKIPILTYFSKGLKPPTRYGIYWLGKKYGHMGIYRVYMVYISIYMFFLVGS